MTQRYLTPWRSKPHWVTGFLTDAAPDAAELHRWLAQVFGIEAERISVFNLDEDAAGIAHENSAVVCNYNRVDGDFRLDLMLSCSIDDLRIPEDARALVQRFSDLSRSRCALSESEAPVWLCFEPGKEPVWISEITEDDGDFAGRFRT